jgi:hypothetical protein
MNNTGYKYAVYIHTNQMNDVPTRIAKYSYKKHNPNLNIWTDKLEDHPELLKYHNYSFYRDGKQLNWDSTKHQAFFPVRFLCVETHKKNNREEKWILVADPDIFCLKNLDVLNEYINEAEKNNLNIISVEGLSSMMLLNTEKINWTEAGIIQDVFVDKNNFNKWMFLQGFSQLRLPKIFNHHDTMDANTVLLHTSNTETQPWKTGIKYKEWELHNKIPSANSIELTFSDHPNQEVKKAVLSLFTEAYEKNLFSNADIDEGITEKALRPDIKHVCNITVKSIILPRGESKAIPKKNIVDLNDGEPVLKDAISEIIKNAQNQLLSSEPKKTKQKQSFILGSGRSLLNLNENEVAHINNSDTSISFNKYLLFYEKIGIVPKYHIQFDAHDDPAIIVFLKTIDKIKNDPKLQNITLVLGKVLGNHAKEQNLNNPIIISGLHPKVGDGWNPNLEEIGWSEQTDKNLFHFKGTLTSVINFSHALRSQNIIKLVGVDMNTNHYFFQGEYEKQKPLHDWTYELMKKSGKHSNILIEVGGYKQDYCIPWMKKQIQKTGADIFICNKNAHYAKGGLMKYSEILT